jgi:superfamily I DNA/RNA helicase
LIALELSVEQRRAVDAPHDACFAITGASATGKSTALRARVARARELHPVADPLVIGEGGSLETFAAGLLRECGAATEIVDDVDAELTFSQACAPLFALEWEEFAANQLDPEVPGLRSPQRFLESAFRLIRRLRDASVTPAVFLDRALVAATDFYAKPPNFADPALLAATKATFRDSLEVTAQDLRAQRLRELDLAKILAKLYERYVHLMASGGRMTGRDAVVAATAALLGDPAYAARLRDRHRFAFVDDAQELTPAEIRLLAALFGDAFEGVTLCGDPAAAISALRVTTPKATFALARSTVIMRADYRNPAREIRRAATPRDEAALIAQRVGGWIGDGVAPDRVAVLFRSVRCVELYENALLDAGIPVAVTGDVNAYADRRALDALALLWNVYDPFRHDWLLRTLGNPAIGLSDASLAILCAEPPDPQSPLFAFDVEPAPTARASRWSAKRDLRLGWNVIGGEQDAALSEDAAMRVRRFRALRERWLALMHAASFDNFARTVWSEGLAREGDPGSPRARAQQLALRRLLAGLNEYAAQTPHAGIGEILEYAQRRLDSDVDTWILDGPHDGCVQMRSIEAARGCDFRRVVVADVRPGGFPRWYSPEAFLFSPLLGMIPKECAGEARAARTAKFTYYTYRSKASQHYFDRERRALTYAIARARENVLLTASGTPTRGITAPEFLTELRNA